MTIDQEMERVSSIKSETDKKGAEDRNNAPCNVCGSKEFVQKFRNVVGEVHGKMCGNFSLFGGSVSGYIDGSTSTLPVLSCRQCENERTVATWNSSSKRDVFWNFMHQFYFKVDSDFRDLYKIDPFFLERPVETREYMMKNKNYEHRFYNECPEWEPEIWAKAGFKIQKVKKRHLLFFEREVYPTWEELIASSSP